MGAWHRGRSFYWRSEGLCIESWLDNFAFLRYWVLNYNFLHNRTRIRCVAEQEWEYWELFKNWRTTQKLDIVGCWKRICSPKSGYTALPVIIKPPANKAKLAYRARLVASQQWLVLYLDTRGKYFIFAGKHFRLVSCFFPYWWECKEHIVCINDGSVKANSWLLILTTNVRWAQGHHQQPDLLDWKEVCYGQKFG